MNSGNFFVELKRRNVYKVAVAYIVAGWALSQGIAQVFPVFDVPNWVVRLLVLLIIVGLPVALVLAWMFEITPQGIKRTETADAMPGATQRKKHAWIYVVVIGGLLSIGLFFLGRYTAQTPAAERGGYRFLPENRSRCCHSTISVAIPTTLTSPKACRMKSSRGLPRSPI